MTPTPEILRLQIELAWTQRDADDLEDALDLAEEALDAALDAARYYQGVADAFNGCLGVLLDHMETDPPASAPDDLHLVDAQIKALTDHREALLKRQAVLV